LKFLALFVHRRVLTTVLVLVAVILGILAYQSLPQRRFPDVQFPVATVTTVYSGGAPAEIESEITQRIEEAVSSISGIDEIESVSQQGISQVTVQFELDEDIDSKAIDVLNKVDTVQGDFPEGAEDPVVEKFEAGQEPVVTLALRGSHSTNRLYRTADEELRERISQISGVSQVQITGGQEREIEVLLNAAQLRRYGLSINQVANALRATNRDIPAGYVTESGQESLIRVTGQFAELSEIREVRIPTPGEGTVKMHHLGRIIDDYKDKRTSSRVDGENAVVLTVQKQSAANAVQVAEAVRDSIPDLERFLPSGTGIIVVEDTSEYITGALSNVQTNMLVGIALTALALFLFLSSGRATLIAGVVIPTAVITSLMPMMFSGFSLNILTMLALALSVGIVVNNSILILENAMRMLEQGYGRQEAAVTGTADIALPVLSMAATNLVVFLPIAFMGEIIGRFFRQFGLTIVYVTIVSLVITLTLTPMMCGRLLKFRRHTRSFLNILPRMWQWCFAHLKNVYLRILDWSLSHRKNALLMWGTMLIAVVGGLGPTLAMEFFPQRDEGRFQVTVQTPAGTPLAETERAVKEVEAAVEELPYVEHYYSRLGRISGSMGGSNRGVNLGEIRVSLTDRGERPLSLTEILNRIRPYLAEISSADVSVKRSGGGPQQDPVSVEVRGNSLEEIRRVGTRIKELMEDVPGTASVSKSWQSGQPEVRIKPLENKLAQHKMTANDVGRSVRAYIDGTLVGEYRDNDERYDIRLRLREEDRQYAERVAGLFVRSPETGQMLKLNRVADVTYSTAPTLITRKERMRYVSVGSQTTGARAEGEIVKDLKQRIDNKIDVPQGVDISYGGQTEMRRKNFKELFQALVTAAVLTFLAVAGIIESFFLACVIIVSLPLSLIGILAAMVIAGVSINVFSLMAMIMLVGMVVNNAIIIVDYATRNDRKNLSAPAQVREACDARYRVIIMANATTIAAMIPLSLGLGFAGEIFRPIAVVQIGGLFAAAVLSLFVIPLIYVMIRRRGANNVEADTH